MRPVVIESLEDAAHSLEMAAEQLRNLISILKHAEWLPQSAPVGDDLSSNGHATPDVREVSIAKKMQELWRGVSLGSEMPVGPVTVDLATAEGRWQLLILAVLRGARVRERVVEETFVALVARGLTDLRRLALGGPSTKTQLLEVFAAHYRALGHREAKVEALMANAALLQNEYGGDLHSLYLASPGEPDALIKALQRFKQVEQVAYWICRTLKVHGIWPDLGPEATQYFDRYTDLPVERLGLRSSFDDERAGTAAMRFAARRLQGDPVPLYLHGLILCSQNEISICRSECPLAPECRHVQKAE